MRRIFIQWVQHSSRQQLNSLQMTLMHGNVNVVLKIQENSATTAVSQNRHRQEAGNANAEQKIQVNSVLSAELRSLLRTAGAVRAEL